MSVLKKENKRGNNMENKRGKRENKRGIKRKIKGLEVRSRG